MPNNLAYLTNPFLFLLITTRAIIHQRSGVYPMLRIDKANKILIPLERKTMRDSGYWERRDIQEMICHTPGPFFEELGENIHIVGSEVQPTEFVLDRIDVLGID